MFFWILHDEIIVYLHHGFTAVFKASYWKPKQNYQWLYTDTRNMDMIQQMDNSLPKSLSGRNTFDNIVFLGKDVICIQKSCTCRILSNVHIWASEQLLWYCNLNAFTDILVTLTLQILAVVWSLSSNTMLITVEERVPFCTMNNHLNIIGGCPFPIAQCLFMNTPGSMCYQQ